MTDQLESDLRAALSGLAAEVPPASVTRLHAVDYHPRSFLLRPRLVIGGGAVLATVTLIMLIAALRPGADKAFAGWTPSPIAPIAGQTASAERACTAGAAAAERRMEEGAASTQHRGSPSTQAAASGDAWESVLVDTRGPYTALILKTASEEMSCFVGPSSQVISRSRASYVGPIPVAPAGTIVPTSTATSPAPVRTEVTGRVGSGVSAVAFLLTDGTQVTATVTGGWFLAWWPSSTQAKSAEVSTASGTKLQPV